MHKAKVLFIIHMPPPVHGASMVGQYIHDSDFINDLFECHYINEGLSSEVSHVGKFEFYKLWILLKHFFCIIKEIRKFKPNLVYITPSASNPQVGNLRFALEFGILNYYHCRKLIHFHNKGNREICKKWYHRWYYKMLFKNSNVVFLSNVLSKQFDWFLKPEQILICSNGIPESGKRKEKIIGKDILHLLFLSNLIEEKGVLVLLDALKILIDKNIFVNCVVVGKETKEIDANRFAKEVDNRYLNQYVFYRGPKFGNEKERYFMEADLFVFPTMNDCFPLVLLEAMSYSLPCITTNQGGISDIIEDGVNGLIASEGDPESLALCIEQMIQDPEMMFRMGESNYTKFLANFTSNVFEHNITECILKSL